MPVCIGCGAVGDKPHTRSCPEDQNLTKQQRWQKRMVKGGMCTVCGARTTKNPRTKKRYSKCDQHRKWEREYRKAVAQAKQLN